MSVIELISDYKFTHTPIGIGNTGLSCYRRITKETRSNKRGRIAIIPFREKIVGAIEESSFENKSREYIKLYSDFKSKWSIKKEHFSAFSETFVFSAIKTTISNLLNLNPEYVTFDLTEDCSAFFQTSVNSKNIYFELFFTKDIEGEVEAIINIYESGKCIFAYGGSIENAFSKINLQINKKTWAFEPTYNQYVLSISSLAEATF